jgi:hypothetical protein
MATKTFYIKDATAAGSSHGSLQDGGTAPSASDTGTGWIVGKTGANNTSIMVYDTRRAASTFGTTNELSNLATNNATTNASWRTETPLAGIFDAGTWTFNFVMSPTSFAGTQNGRMNVRVYRSSNANGSANAVTSAVTGTNVLVGTATGAMGSTSTDYDTTVTWTNPSFKLTNEYLFVVCQWEIIAAGGANGSDVVFRTGASANIVSSNFTPINKTAIIT